MWTVDGARGEGGGQILRVAVGLACALGEDVRIENVRAGRDSPGLRPQHLAAVEGIQALCSAEVEGAEVGSTEVTLRPGPVEGGTVRVRVGTAGSVTLVLQTLLLGGLAADGAVRLEVSGGTDVRWSPPWDLFVHVLVPHLEAMGLDVETKLIRRGHYPEGGGRVAVTLEPRRPSAVPLAPPTRHRIAGRIHLTDLPDHIAQRMRDTVTDRLGPVDLPVDRTPGTTGCGVALWRVDEPRLGASALGEPGRPAEDVAEAAVDALQAEVESRACVDIHTADQLLPFLALADAPTSYVVRQATGHLETLAGLLGDLQIADVSVRSGERVEVSVRPEGAL